MVLFHLLRELHIALLNIRKIIKYLHLIQISIYYQNSL
nr:MAG TPA: hypothetical protein [Bacteriophage sp.]